jgi:poly(A) polymerase
MMEFENNCADASWLKWPEARLLVEILGFENVRFVGGAVRDYLLGVSVSDVDIATPLVPSVVMELLALKSIRVIPTGIEHGTVTALVGAHKFEITTLRLDVETDGRRAIVAFSQSWQEDAARRDFTINALYADAGGKIYDYFGGLDDLRARKIRFIGDASSRITEDALRILRFFRFHGRIEQGVVDAAGLAACTKLSRMQMSLSRERIRDELLKILALNDPLPTIHLMLENGILSPILPELTDFKRLSLICQRQKMIGTHDAPQRLAALAPSSSQELTKLGQRLRLSNKECVRLAAMARPWSWNGDQLFLDRLIYKMGTQNVLDLAVLHEDEVVQLQRINDRTQRWIHPILPIRGQQLIDLGVGAGPDVSRLLRVFETAWMEANFPLDEISVNALLADVLAADRNTIS